ncbi:MAG TPA: branched-chain amino acid ABC transporter permease [Candidatus Dormibacteraeota bacterium]|jgi:branched-chain amino acid transport system permease protein|nr:branched-chain amino acid ABC transporter permease [Candidatus Dormibacteraeota bacterium]
MLASAVLASLEDFKNNLPTGLASGGVFALAALGLVLIYRVSGVLNFAHGAVATVSAFVAYTFAVQLLPDSALGPWIGLLAAIVAGCVLGFLIEVLTIRPLTGRPPIVKVAVTIGWLLVLQQLAGLVWGFTAYHSAINLVGQDATFHVPGTTVRFGYNSLLVIVVALALSGATAFLLQRTTLGTAMRAVSDDPRGARLWGINVDRVTALSWVIGSAMAALAGVLITPFILFTPFTLTLIVVNSFAAALLGRLQSLTFTVAGAMALGVGQQVPSAFGAAGTATAQLVTFGVVLLALAVLFRPGVRALRTV